MGDPFSAQNCQMSRLEGRFTFWIHERVVAHLLHNKLWIDFNGGCNVILNGMWAKAISGR